MMKVQSATAKIRCESILGDTAIVTYVVKPHPTAPGWIVTRSVEGRRARQMHPRGTAVCGESASAVLDQVLEQAMIPSDFEAKRVLIGRE